MLIAYYFIWHTGRPAPEQCDGCTFYTSQVRELSFLHSRVLDLTVYGRQETWEDSPAGWPKWPEGAHQYRTDGRPIVQWSRLNAGHSDDLGTGRQ